MRFQDYVIVAVCLMALGKGFLSADSSSRSGNPVEVGHVIWERNYDSAATASKKSGKPIFALFQEVPG